MVIGGVGVGVAVGPDVAVGMGVVVAFGVTVIDGDGVVITVMVAVGVTDSFGEGETVVAGVTVNCGMRSGGNCDRVFFFDKTERIEIMKKKAIIKIIIFTIHIICSLPF